MTHAEGHGVQGSPTKHLVLSMCVVQQADLAQLGLELHAGAAEYTN